MGYMLHTTSCYTYTGLTIIIIIIIRRRCVRILYDFLSGVFAAARLCAGVPPVENVLTATRGERVGGIDKKKNSHTHTKCLPYIYRFGFYCFK